MTPAARDAARQAVRRETLANLMITLTRQALDSGGRLVVEPWTPEAFVLGFPATRVLVRREGRFLCETTDVRMIVVGPPEWPFVRTEMLRPAVVEPVDWAHPNARAAICIDLAGITPDRLAATLYDVVRLARKRLDHPLDPDAAAFVRAHLDAMPTDPRPLFPLQVPASHGDLPLPAPSCDPTVAPLPFYDLAVGVLAVAVPALDVPTFLRLAPATSGEIDEARRRYLVAARPQLRVGVPAWRDGAGLVAGPTIDTDPVLAAEVAEVARGLAVLGEPAMARRYLVHGPSTPTVEGGMER